MPNLVAYFAVDIGILGLLLYALFLHHRWMYWPGTFGKRMCQKCRKVEYKLRPRKQTPFFKVWREIEDPKLAAYVRRFLFHSPDEGDTE